MIFAMDVWAAKVRHPGFYLPAMLGPRAWVGHRERIVTLEIPRLEVLASLRLALVSRPDPRPNGTASTGLKADCGGCISSAFGNIAETPHRRATVISHSLTLMLNLEVPCSPELPHCCLKARAAASPDDVPRFEPNRFIVLAKPAPSTFSIQQQEAFRHDAFTFLPSTNARSKPSKQLSTHRLKSIWNLTARPHPT
ncbi:hypothetical protein B0H67DRAFT_63436 [Lasiosphaeris hirsuta]|uniref:Uncharacterized protein n=1 Tax=Lasiosphaeris hirsuta TaxID=260670 RepID=A0AA40EDD0_9PEZI|nr:hypothetical protein B0H67DRAFT_63436 [Lasiosphaeris hirsuta]